MEVLKNGVKTRKMKDRLTDLMLLVFAKDGTGNTAIDIRDKGNVLIAETEEKMIDCADYLTSTEIKTLQAIHDAAAFAACTADAVLKIFYKAHPEGASDEYFIQNYNRCLGGPERDN